LQAGAYDAALDFGAEVKMLLADISGGQMAMADAWTHSARIVDWITLAKL